jgi:hypothetical protein
MTKKNQCTQFLVLLTGLAAAPRIASAIEPSDLLIYSREPVSLRPQLGLTETYNDNIFYQPKSVADFITTISPGLTVILGRDQRFISLDYTFNQHFYADRSDLNTGEHLFDLRNHFAAQRFSITGNDQVQLLSTPIGSVQEFRTISDGPGGSTPTTPTTPTPTPSGGDLTASPARGGEVVTTAEQGNVERTAQYHNYTLGFKMTDKTSMYLQGVYTETDYEEGIGVYDLETIRGTAGFAFQAFPKTSLFGEIYYGQTTTTPNFPAPKNPRSDFVGGFIGARGQFTEKLTGVVKVGYEERWFSDDSSAPSTPVVDVALSQRFTDKTSASLSYARVHDISVQFARESYTANIISAQLNQALGTTGKWLVTIGGNLGLYDYDPIGAAPERSYTRYAANFDLAYRIQLWLTASLGYRHETISSDSGQFSEYDVNRVNVSLAIGY